MNAQPLKLGWKTVKFEEIAENVAVRVDPAGRMNSTLHCCSAGVMLRAGHYIQPEDERTVHRVLQAAALTYVAGSLASLLNLARWFAFLRRA